MGLQCPQPAVLLAALASDTLPESPVARGGALGLVLLSQATLQGCPTNCSVQLQCAGHPHFRGQGLVPELGCCRYPARSRLTVPPACCALGWTGIRRLHRAFWLYALLLGHDCSWANESAGCIST